jgi:hypothetical protein
MSKPKLPYQFHTRVHQHLHIFLRIWYLPAKALSESRTSESELQPHKSAEDIAWGIK